MKGILITFEGTEGSGKSTQAKLLYLYLKKEGYPVIYLREPGGTRISEKIREILLDYKNGSMSGMCEMLLYMASRAQLVNEVIKPALLKGKIVICDRFSDSTVAYQGSGLGVDIKLIRYLGGYVTGGIAPRMTFFLDSDVETGLRRSFKTKGFADRIERRNCSFHRRVRDSYRALAEEFPQRIKAIQVDNYTRQQVQQIIRKEVLDAVKRYKRARAGY